MLGGNIQYPAAGQVVGRQKLDVGHPYYKGIKRKVPQSQSQCTGDGEVGELPIEIFPAVYCNASLIWFSEQMIKLG